MGERNNPNEVLVTPVDIEKMPAEDANKMKVLLLEDRAKYAFEIAQHKMAIAGLEAAIAKTDVVLADLDRKVAGVDYPAAPEEKSQMGEPVDGPEAK